MKLSEQKSLKLKERKNKSQSNISVLGKKHKERNTSFRRNNGGDLKNKSLKRVSVSRVKKNAKKDKRHKRKHQGGKKSPNTLNDTTNKMELLKVINSQNFGGELFQKGGELSRNYTSAEKTGFINKKNYKNDSGNGKYKCYEMPLKECFKQGAGKEKLKEITDKYQYIYDELKEAMEKLSQGKEAQSGGRTAELKPILPPPTDEIKTDSQNLAFFARFAQFHNLIRSIEYNGIKVKHLVFMIVYLKNKYIDLVKKRNTISNPAEEAMKFKRHTQAKQQVLKEIYDLYEILFDTMEKVKRDSGNKTEEEIEEIEGEKEEEREEEAARVKAEREKLSEVNDLKRKNEEFETASRKDKDKIETLKAELSKSQNELHEIIERETSASDKSLLNSLQKGHSILVMELPDQIVAKDAATKIQTRFRGNRARREEEGHKGGSVQNQIGGSRQAKFIEFRDDGKNMLVEYDDGNEETIPTYRVVVEDKQKKIIERLEKEVNSSERALEEMRTNQKTAEGALEQKSVEAENLLKEKELEKQQIEKLKKESQEFASLKSKVEQENELNEKQKQKLESEGQEKEQQIQEYIKTISEKDKTIKQKEEEIQEITREHLIKLNEEKKQQQAAAQRDRETSGTEVTRLTGILQEKETEIADLKQENEEINQAKDETVRMLAESKTTEEAKVESVKDEVKKHLSAVAEAHRAAEEVRTQLKETTQSKEKLTTKISDLESEIQSLKLVQDKDDNVINQVRLRSKVYDLYKETIRRLFKENKLSHLTEYPVIVPGEKQQLWKFDIGIETDQTGKLTKLNQKHPAEEATDGVARDTKLIHEDGKPPAYVGYPYIKNFNPYILPYDPRTSKNNVMPTIWKEQKLGASWVGSKHHVQLLKDVTDGVAEESDRETSFQLKNQYADYLSRIGSGDSIEKALFKPRPFNPLKLHDLWYEGMADSQYDGEGNTWKNATPYHDKEKRMDQINWFNVKIKFFEKREGSGYLPVTAHLGDLLALNDHEYTVIQKEPKYLAENETQRMWKWSQMPTQRKNVPFNVNNLFMFYFQVLKPLIDKDIEDKTQAVKEVENIKEELVTAQSERDEAIGKLRKAETDKEAIKQGREEITREKLKCDTKVIQLQRESKERVVKFIEMIKLAINTQLTSLWEDKKTVSELISQLAGTGQRDSAKSLPPLAHAIIESTKILEPYLEKTSGEKITLRKLFGKLKFSLSKLSKPEKQRAIKKYELVFTDDFQPKIDGAEFETGNMVGTPIQITSSTSTTTRTTDYRDVINDDLLEIEKVANAPTYQTGDRSSSKQTGTRGSRVKKRVDAIEQKKTSPPPVPTRKPLRPAPRPPIEESARALLRTKEGQGGRNLRDPAGYSSKTPRGRAQRGGATPKTIVDNIKEYTELKLEVTYLTEFITYNLFEEIRKKTKEERQKKGEQEKSDEEDRRDFNNSNIAKFERFSEKIFSSVTAKILGRALLTSAVSATTGIGALPIILVKLLGDFFGPKIAKHFNEQKIKEGIFENKELSERIIRLGTCERSYELAKLILTTVNNSEKEVEKDVNKCVKNMKQYLTVNMPIPVEPSEIMEKTARCYDDIIEKLNEIMKPENLLEKLNTDAIDEIFNENLSEPFVDSSKLFDSFDKFVDLVNKYASYNDGGEGDTETTIKDQAKTEVNAIIQTLEGNKNAYLSENEGGSDIQYNNQIDVLTRQFYYKQFIFVSIPEEIKLFNMIKIKTKGRRFRDLGMDTRSDDDKLLEMREYIQNNNSNDFNMKKIMMEPMMKAYRSSGELLTNVSSYYEKELERVENLKKSSDGAAEAEAADEEPLEGLHVSQFSTQTLQMSHFATNDSNSFSLEDYSEKDVSKKRNVYRVTNPFIEETDTPNETTPRNIIGQLAECYGNEANIIDNAELEITVPKKTISVSDLIELKWSRNRYIMRQQEHFNDFDLVILNNDIKYIYYLQPVDSGRLYFNIIPLNTVKGRVERVDTITVFKSYYNEVNMLKKTIIPTLTKIGTDEKRIMLPGIMLDKKVELITKKLQEKRKECQDLIDQHLEIKNNIMKIIQQLHDKTKQSDEVFKKLNEFSEQVQEESAGEEGSQDDDESLKSLTIQKLMERFYAVFKKEMIDNVEGSYSHNVFKFIKEHTPLIFIGMSNNPLSKTNTLKQRFINSYMNKENSADSINDELTPAYNIDMWNIVEHDRNIVFGYEKNAYQNYPLKQMLESFGQYFVNLHFYKKVNETLFSIHKKYIQDGRAYLDKLNKSIEIKNRKKYTSKNIGNAMKIGLATTGVLLTGPVSAGIMLGAWEYSRRATSDEAARNISNLKRWNELMRNDYKKMNEKFDILTVNFIVDNIAPYDNNQTIFKQFIALSNYDYNNYALRMKETIEKTINPPLKLIMEEIDDFNKTPDNKREVLLRKITTKMKNIADDIKAKNDMLKQKYKELYDEKKSERQKELGPLLESIELLTIEIASFYKFSGATQNRPIVAKLNDYSLGLDANRESFTKELDRVEKATINLKQKINEDPNVKKLLERGGETALAAGLVEFITVLAALSSKDNADSLTPDILEPFANIFSLLFGGLLPFAIISPTIEPVIVDESIVETPETPVEDIDPAFLNLDSLTGITGFCSTIFLPATMAIAVVGTGAIWRQYDRWQANKEHNKLTKQLFDPKMGILYNKTEFKEMIEQELINTVSSNEKDVTKDIMETINKYKNIVTFQDSIFDSVKEKPQNTMYEVLEKLKDNIDSETGPLYIKNKREFAMFISTLSLSDLEVQPLMKDEGLQNKTKILLHELVNEYTLMPKDTPKKDKLIKLYQMCYVYNNFPDSEEKKKYIVNEEEEPLYILPDCYSFINAKSKNEKNMQGIVKSISNNEILSYSQLQSLKQMINDEKGDFKNIKFYEEGPEKIQIEILKTIRESIRNINSELKYHKPLVLNSHTLLEQYIGKKGTGSSYNEMNNSLMYLKDVKPENVDFIKIQNNLRTLLNEELQVQALYPYGIELNNKESSLLRNDSFYYYKVKLYKRKELSSEMEETQKAEAFEPMSPIFEDNAIMQIVWILYDVPKDERKVGNIMNNVTFAMVNKFDNYTVDYPNLSIWEIIQKTFNDFKGGSEIIFDEVDKPTEMEKIPQDTIHYAKMYLLLKKTFLLIKLDMMLPPIPDFFEATHLNDSKYGNKAHQGIQMLLDGTIKISELTVVQDGQGEGEGDDPVVNDITLGRNKNYNGVDVHYGKEEQLLQDFELVEGESYNPDDAFNYRLYMDKQPFQYKQLQLLELRKGNEIAATILPDIFFTVIPNEMEFTKTHFIKAESIVNYIMSVVLHEASIQSEPVLLKKEVQNDMIKHFKNFKYTFVQEIAKLINGNRETLSDGVDRCIRQFYEYFDFETLTDDSENKKISEDGNIFIKKIVNNVMQEFPLKGQALLLSGDGKGRPRARADAQDEMLSNSNNGKNKNIFEITTIIDSYIKKIDKNNGIFDKILDMETGPDERIESVKELLTAEDIENIEVLSVKKIEDLSDKVDSLIREMATQQDKVTNINLNYIAILHLYKKSIDNIKSYLTEINTAAEILITLSSFNDISTIADKKNNNEFKDKKNGSITKVELLQDQKEKIKHFYNKNYSGVLTLYDDKNEDMLIEDYLENYFNVSSDIIGGSGSNNKKAAKKKAAKKKAVRKKKNPRVVPIGEDQLETKAKEQSEEEKEQSDEEKEQSDDEDDVDGKQFIFDDFLKWKDEQQQDLSDPLKIIEKRKDNLIKINTRIPDVYQINDEPFGINVNDCITIREIFVDDIDKMSSEIEEIKRGESVKVSHDKNTIIPLIILNDMHTMQKHVNNIVINKHLIDIFKISLGLTPLTKDYIFNKSEFNEGYKLFIRVLETQMYYNRITNKKATLLVGGAKTDDKFNPGDIDIVLSEPGDREIDRINSFLLLPLETEIYTALFHNYNTKSFIKTMKTNAIMAQKKLQDSYFEIMKTPDLLLGFQNMIMGSLKGIVHVGDGILREILETKQTEMEQYIKLRTFLHYAYMKEMTDQEFIDRLIKSSLNPLSSSEIGTYDQEQLKGIENIVYFYANSDNFKKTTGFSSKKLEYAIEDSRNKIVRKDTKSKNTVRKKFSRWWKGETLITNDEFIKMKLQLNKIWEVYHNDSSQGGGQSGGAASDVFTNDMAPDDAENNIKKLAEKIQERNSDDNDTPDDPKQFCIIYKDLCTPEGIREIGEKFVTFLIDNAETSNLELLEMDAVDNNAVEYLKLSNEMIVQYKKFTSKIITIEREKLDVQSIPIEQIYAQMKECITLLEGFSVDPGILSRERGMPGGVGPGVVPSPITLIPSIKAEVSKIASKIAKIEVQIQSLLHSSNSILTSNSFISVGVEKTYENIYEKLNDSDTTISPEKDMKNFKKYISDLISKNVLPELDEPSERGNKLENIISTYTTIMNLIKQKNEDIKEENNNNNTKVKTENLEKGQPKTIPRITVIQSKTHIAFSKYVRAVNEYYSIVQTAIDNYKKLEDLKSYRTGDDDDDYDDEDKKDDDEDKKDDVSSKFLKEEVFERRLEDIEKNIPPTEMKKTMEEDTAFKRIFNLSNDINIECIRAKEFISTHEQEDYERLKGRGKTTKQRLKPEVKRISHIRSRMSKLENTIVKTLKQLIDKRMKKVSVVSKKIVKLLETPGVRRKRKLMKIMSRSLALVAGQAVLGAAGPIKLAADAIGALGAGTVGAATADVLGEIASSVSDPIFYQATGELIKDGILHGASDITNPDWYQWRAGQIEAGFAQGLDDFTNTNWWEWKGSQIEQGTSELRPDDLPEGTADEVVAADVTADVAEDVVATDVPAGAAAAVVDDAAGAAAQTGGGFFRTKPLDITDEEADKQVAIMIEILDIYQMFVDANRENDEKYRKMMSKSMNKFTNKGKTQKKGLVGTLISIPSEGSTLLQNRRTRKARKKVESRIQQKKNTSKYGNFMKKIFGEKDPEFVKNVKKLKSVNESYKNVQVIYHDAKIANFKEMQKARVKQLRKPLSARDVERYREKKLRYENKKVKLINKMDKQKEKLEKANKIVDINDRLKGINANTILSSFERQQKKKIKRLTRNIEKSQKKMNKYDGLIKQIDQMLEEQGGTIAERSKKAASKKKQQVGGAEPDETIPNQPILDIPVAEPVPLPEVNPVPLPEVNPAPLPEVNPAPVPASAPPAELLPPPFEEEKETEQALPYIPSKYPQQSTIENYRLGDYDFTDEDSLRNSIALRASYYEILNQNTASSHQMIQKLHGYFKDITNNKFIDQLKQNLSNAVALSKKENRAVRKLRTQIEQEQTIFDMLPYTNYSDNLQRLLPASTFTNVRRKARGRLNWMIRRTLTGIYAPVDFAMSGLDVTLKAARAHRPGYMSRESRRDLSEKKRDAQRRFKQKFIEKTDITQEQLASFEKFHNQNEDFALAYAEEKVNAEKELFTAIERIKQLILDAFPVQDESSFTNSTFKDEIQSIWDAITLNSKYFNSDASLENNLVTSTTLSVMYASILQSKRVDENDKKKLIEHVEKKSQSIEPRNNLMNKLFDQNIVLEYWDCYNTCNSGKTGAENKEKRNNYLLKLVANIRERRFNLEQLRELLTTEIEKDDEDELPMIIAMLSDKFETLANIFDMHEENLYSIIDLVKETAAKELPKEKEDELIKIGNQIEKHRKNTEIEIEYIRDSLLYAIPEWSNSYNKQLPDIEETKKLWNSITEVKNDANTDYEFINALKTTRDLLFITQNLEKSHEIVLQTIEFVIDARNARVEQNVNEEKARVSNEIIDTLTYENITNDKIKNRNDNISRIKMAIETGEIKDEEERPIDVEEDMNREAGGEEDSDFDTDEEDDEDDPFRGDPADENTLFKYWYCNGKCDNRKALNPEEFNWSGNVSTRERETRGTMKKLETMREKINELTEFFMSKDKDIAEISQIKAAIQDAAKSNKAQIAVMKDIIKVVEKQKSLVKQFTKSGRMREQKGVLIKTKFVPKNTKLERNASKKLGKMAGFDTGFKNAMKTLREIVTEKYPQEGTRVGAEESEKIMADDIMKILILSMRIIKMGEEPNEGELQSFAESLVVAIKAGKSRERIKKNKDKEKRQNELDNFDNLVDKASEEKSRDAIDERNELLDKLFDISSDLQLKDSRFITSATAATNKEEAIQKYWFCNNKCKYSFTEDVDWTTNIQNRISYVNEMKQKAIRSKRAFTYLMDIFRAEYKLDFAKVGTELELDLEEKVALVGGATANSQENLKPRSSIKFFEDVFAKLKMIQEHTVKEVTATQKIHDLALQMRKIYSKTTTTKTRVLRKKGQREISGKDTRKKSKYSINPNFRSQLKSLENKVVIFANQKSFSAEKIQRLCKEIMKLIKTKMPEIDGKEVTDNDEELHEQLTLIWDSIHANLMHHFSRYSERGELLVHSTLSSHKLVRINRVMRSESNRGIKAKLDKHIQKAISLANKDPNSVATHDIIRKRNEIINGQYEKADDIEKTMAEKEKAAAEFVRTSKRKEQAQEYERMRKERVERERQEAEQNEQNLEEDIQEMEGLQKNQLELIAQEAIQKRLQVEEKLNTKNMEREEFQKELEGHQGELDSARAANDQANEKLSGAIQNNKDAIEKRTSLSKEKKAVDEEVLKLQRELQEARDKGDDANAASVSTRIKELQERSGSIDKALIAVEDDIKNSEGEVNNAMEQQANTQKIFDEKEGQFNNTMKKQEDLDEEIRGLEREARAARITEENAKESIRGLVPEEEKEPEKRFMLTVRERDSGEKRIPAAIDFTMSGDLLKHKIGDIKNMFNEKAKQQTATAETDNEAEDLVSSLRQAVDNYITRTQSMEKSKVDELNSQAGDILNKIDLQVTK